MSRHPETVRFSVVIPLYNKGPYIKRTLDSVLMQTIGDYEVVIVDDGSADEGPGLVANYSDPRIRLVSQENCGVSAARNRGIAEARGEWIAFLDADDTWKPDYLQNVAGLIDKFPDAGAYATAYEIIMADGRIKYPEFEAIPPPPWEGMLPSYFRSALGPPPLCTGAVTIHKKILCEVGCFPMGVHTGEDLDMWGRVALRYPIAFSRCVGVSYRQDDRSRGNRVHYYFTHPEAAFVRSAREAMERGDVGSIGIADVKEYVAKLQIEIGRLCVQDGRNPAASRSILLATSPATPRLRWKKRRLLVQSFFPVGFMKTSISVARRMMAAIRRHR